MEFIKLILTGFVLGITSVIPGISTATMAVVFNVYDRLINVIVPNVKKVLAAWSFWLPIVIGGAAGVLFASKVLKQLFNHYFYEVPTYWFFIGIIAGSIPLIYSRIVPSKTPESDLNSTKPRSCCKACSLLPSMPSAISAIIAFSLMVLMVMLNPEKGVTVHTELTLPLFGILVLVGVLGAVSMIVPGISGAFVLLVIGFYRTITGAVSDFNILILIPFAIGACAGILLGAALVRFLLAKAPRITYGAVLGLVAGSIIVLYSEANGFGSNFELIEHVSKNVPSYIHDLVTTLNTLRIITSITCLLVGFTLSFFIGRKKRETNSVAKST